MASDLDFDLDMSHDLDLNLDLDLDLSKIINGVPGDSIFSYYRANVEQTLRWLKQAY